MNLLISCPGRMVELVYILKHEFAEAGYGVIATGNSSIIPGLYAADKAYIVPAVDDREYIPHLLELCERNGISAMLSLLDKDILAVSKAAPDFRKIGVTPIMVDYETARICENKHMMYELMLANGIKCALTYRTLIDFKIALSQKEIEFPVFVKPVAGEKSRGVRKCINLQEVSLSMSLQDDLIVQQYLEGPQYDIDVYVDIMSGEMVSVFAKENLSMLNGVSNKAVSVIDKKIFSVAEQVVQSLGAVGPIDIEIMRHRGEYYVNEVNPRLEASYPIAYACGVNFGPLMVNNLCGIQNQANIGQYEPGQLLLKYDQAIIRNSTQMLA